MTHVDQQLHGKNWYLSEKVENTFFTRTTVFYATFEFDLGHVRDFFPAVLNAGLHVVLFPFL